jgi:hypothetical protein
MRQIHAGCARHIRESEQMLRAPAARNKGCYFWTLCMFLKHLMEGGVQFIYILFSVLNNRPTYNFLPA